MALQLQPYINFSITDGLTINILDYSGNYDSVLNPTGYGAPNIDILAVNATQFILSSYLTEITPQSSTSIIAGTEYIVGGIGTFVYDTKTYTSGQTFISMLSGTPTLGTCTITTTGRFSSASSFLPSQVISLPLSPSLAIGTNDLIYLDSSYTLAYTIFTTKYIAQVGIPAGTYIIYGTIGQTAIVSGVTYRINEVMVQSGIFTMTGTASIALFAATTTTSQQLSYYASQAEINMELQVAQSSFGNRGNLTEALERISTDYAAIKDYFQLNLGVDYSGAQILFNEIASISANPNFV